MKPYKVIVVLSYEQEFIVDADGFDHAVGLVSRRHDAVSTASTVSTETKSQNIKPCKNTPTVETVKSVSPLS